MEENRRFSWADLFIKMIIVAIFILFTVWLLSLSTNGLSNSLDVLTNNIFSENLRKMKEVGKEYFTVERLPEKIGEIKTITLEDMYEKNLILEITDKNGNACSAKDSYVSVEKYENEYQMKVYLECDSQSDYIIVIMGCYDYCENDICELNPDELTEIEYEYKKTTGGSWKEYGKWSEWSKVSVTKTDYRQVETKVEKEEYTYDKTVTDVVYEELEASCPSGYSKTSDGTKCYKVVTNKVYEDPVCKKLNGWSEPVRNGFTCTYTKNVTSTKTDDAVCKDGYVRDGNSCVKTITDEITKTASCPSGYKASGNTCIESNIDTKDPVCPKLDGYTKTSQKGFTCTYRANNYNQKETLSKKPVDSGDCYDVLPSSTSKYFYKQTSSTPKFVCLDSCAIHTYITYDVYEKIYDTKTDEASCSSGYKVSGNTCVEATPDTEDPICPVVDGYTKTSQSGFTCNYSKTTVDTKKPTCPVKTGYTSKRNGFTCTYSKTTTESKTEFASCPSGYNKSNNTCSKTVSNTLYEDLIKTCPVGYNKSSDGSKCYKEVVSTEKVTGTRDVTYYRYRVREYVGGTTDYKWSKSKEDKKLLDAGYKLTGRTR